MSENTTNDEVKLLTFEVLHPIRDFVIDHGIEEHSGHPLRYVRMRLDDEEEELVICAHTSKEHTRLRISMGDNVPKERLMAIVFEDEPKSYLWLDSQVSIQDLITLSMAIRSGYSVVETLESGEKN